MSIGRDAMGYAAQRTQTAMASRAPRWVRGTLAGALIALGVLALAPLASPSPRGADAPADAFSAARGFTDLQVVAAEPHPVGSAANRAVRDHLVERSIDAGLSVEVQRLGGAENVIARLRGAASTGDLLLTAHYDAAPAAPGAGDAGVAVASLLESMRALAEGPQLRNDVVFLFSDGEEAGWLGAKAFIESPLAESVAVVIAMESEPGAGPTTLQQTTPGDGWLVRQLSAADAPAWANSIINSAERDDFDSDFDVLSGGGLVGMEFSNPKDASRYHSPDDTVDAIDLSHLQAHGDTVLALARHLGDLDLSSAGSEADRAVITLPVVGIVTYPAAVANGLAIASFAAVVGSIAYLIRRGRLGARAFARGTLITGAAMAALAVAATVTWTVVTEMSGGSETADFPDFDGSATALALLYGAVGAAMALALRRYSRQHSPLDVAVGALVWLSVFQVLLMAAGPLGLAVTTWPLLAGTAAVIVWSLAPIKAAVPMLIVAAAPAILLILPFLALWVESPGEPVAVMMLPAMLLFGVLVPCLSVALGCTEPDRSPAATESQAR